MDAVANDYGFLEHCRVVLEDDDEILFTVIDDSLRTVADAGYFHGATGGSRKGEIPLGSCHCAIGCSLLNYERPDYGLVAGVSDYALEGDVLSSCYQTETCKQDQHCDFFHQII